MESAPAKTDSLTTSQRQAVEARGNVLVMAGAGTGKTKTLVARCLDCLEREGASLDELLVVTFTEAAAAEMRQRLRRAIEAKTQAVSLNPQPASLNFWSRQLALFDIAHIGTLHSFCLRLVREHFHELGLDPQIAVLDEGEARQRAGETLDEQFQAHYAGEDDFSVAVQNLIQIHGGGRDEKIRALMLRLHHYSQTRPDGAGWLAEQIKKFSAAEPADWQRWLFAAIENWRDEWLPLLEGLKKENIKAAEIAGVLSRLGSAPAPDAAGDASVADVRRGGASNRTRGAGAPQFTREIAAEVLEQIVAADGNWPAKRKTILREPLADLFGEAAFLAALAMVKNGADPLVEDWSWVRRHMETLLRLAQEFAKDFGERKRADGVLDFHDLEQFTLALLWDKAGDQPTAVAEIWRQKLRFVFVDEYQDINAAQDRIIAALARDSSGAPPSGGSMRPPEGGTPNAGNRFLVGDVKQSIYRFRLADPRIFRDYSRDWHGANGQVIPLSENFRSRESLLEFVNSVFAPLMREEFGGVQYDDNAKLKPGKQRGETPGEVLAHGHHSDTARGDARPTNNEPRTELLLRFKPGRGESSEAEADSGAEELADLDETQKEARLLAMRLIQLRAEPHTIWDDEEKVFRAAEWRDMAVLLRAMSGKSEVYALEFERAGVPLVVARGGFYDSREIADLLSLLQLLDNPLQDVPCISVLRSPLVGLSLDELATIRLAATRAHFWTALNRDPNETLKIKNEAAEKVSRFLERFSRWRKLARQASLSRCLEQVLAETHYAEWLRSRPRGLQRHANLGRFLHLTQKFDQFQRQGLFRFLKFIEAQREAEVEPEAAAVAEANAVRLMSIHQSKGLEFPVVAIADLAKPFNQQDRSAEIIFDEAFGLCPRVQPPSTRRRYSSLPHWLAQRHQRHEQAGEELRLLYVAMTRARDTLILTGSVAEKKWETLWTESGAVTSQKILAAKSYADWLGLWFAQQPGTNAAKGGTSTHFCWRIAADAELGNEKIEIGKQKTETELPELNDNTLLKLRQTLAWQYGFGAATERAAKSSVTELRRQAADAFDDEAEPVFPARPPSAAKSPPSGLRPAPMGAADAGTAHHRFLQHVSLENVDGVRALEAEAGRLEREKFLSADERTVLDLNAVAAFWDSGEGRKIRQQTAHVQRELAFTAKFSPAELSEIIGTKPSPGLEDEFVVVQGVADMVVLLPAEIWLLDFKTDEFGAGGLPAKIKAYAPQLKLYARALEKTYARPVTNCWLHFLALRHSEPID